MKISTQLCVSSVLLMALLAGCNQQPVKTSKSSAPKVVKVADRSQVAELEKKLAAAKAENQQLRSAPVVQAAAPEGPSYGKANLPPSAKPGECYARVLVPAKYKTKTEKRLKRQAGTKIVVVSPAQYGWETKKMMAKGETEKLKIIPATYKTVVETIRVKQETETLTTIPAKYKTVSTKILSKPASEKITTIPARYKTVTEKVMVKPGYTTWKRGRGPVQRIDNATGEIMCLVEIPPEYKNVTKRVVAQQPRTVKKKIPAEYKNITKTVVATPAKVIKKKIPAVFKKVNKTVVATPARVVRKKIPATFKTVKIKKLVKPPVTKRVKIPASYQTVTKRVKISQEHMEWRPILCETNTTSNIVNQLQKALKSRGYYRGPIDGIVGSETMDALKKFQKSKGLPAGQLTNESLKELGIRK